MKLFQIWDCRIIIVICLVVTTQTSVCISSPGDSFSIDQFGKIMVLESGRKKPMDTYARNKLVQFSGKQTLKGESALKWMGRVLFESQNADKDLIFLINNPEIADALGIKPRPKRRYSYSEMESSSDALNALISEILVKEQDDWTPFDKEILRLNTNLKEFLSLRSLFSFTEPEPQFQITDSTLSRLLGITMNRPVTYLQLLYRTQRIAGKIQDIQWKDNDSQTSYEQSMTDLTKKMRDLEMMFGNPQPHIIPEFTFDGEQWYSLWGLLNRYHTDAMPHVLMNLMINMKQCYVGKNQEEFNDAVKQYREFVATIFGKNKTKISNPDLEILYNRLNPFFSSKILYGVAALFSLLAVSMVWKYSYRISISLIIIGLILHTTGLLLRLLIMGHPPVSNLYETFVLTAWVLALIGIVLEILKMKSSGILISSVTGFIFLHVASRYSRDGDTMGMLIAVLDSSFWLTTHIVTISLGYAGFVAAGVVAHLYLIQKMIKKESNEQINQSIRIVYGLFAFGLIFTVTGTVLGGLWADQAWGRFWGWDPKENGALLIIIWALIVLHARIAGLIKTDGLAIGSIVGVVMVMCTWIGVNLLGIGLHSYGKVSGGGEVFLIYLGVEFSFLVITWIALQRREKNSEVVHV